MAYSCKLDWVDGSAPARFSISPHLYLCSHPCIQVLDMAIGPEVWRIVNFYHDIRDASALEALMALDLDPLIPTMVTRDFNMHSRLWSPPDITPSRWAGRVEEWAIGNLLILANKPGVITRRGAKHKTPSIIDLRWYNEMVVHEGVFHSWTLDWNGAMGSDHAMTHIEGSTFHPEPKPPQANLRYVISAANQQA